MNLKIDLNNVDNLILLPIDNIIDGVNSCMDAYNSLSIPAEFNYHSEVVEIGNSFVENKAQLDKSKEFFDLVRKRVINYEESYKLSVNGIVSDSILPVGNRVNK